MAPEVSSQMVHAKSSVGRSCSSRKKQGKVPKKIHKAEREKLKRDYFNELFLELATALEPTRQNNGKASILADATRILQELISQVECLKKENKALVSESHYVTVEKNELKDENAALEAQIEELHSQLKERAQTNRSLNTTATQFLNSNYTKSSPDDVVDPALHVPPVVGPLLVIPLHHDLQPFSDPGMTRTSSTAPSNVRRPQARYATSLDSWPSQLLSGQGQPKPTDGNKDIGKE